MSKWINNKKILWKKIIKPCRICGFCPYGQLVEEFPLDKKIKENISCGIFGHHCPVFYHAELFVEDKKIVDKDWDGMYKEFEKAIKEPKRKVKKDG